MGEAWARVASLEEELSNTRWKPRRALARGGMAEVHVVSDRHIGGEWALKVLSPELAWPGEGATPEEIARHERELEALAQRLLAEARLMREAKHENVVRVHEYGVTRAGRPFLVMDLLEGETLKQALRERRRFEPSEAVDLLRQALRGIEWVHRLDAVHRDLKPENLFWCAPGTTVGADGKPHEGRVLKILDFGIAKLLTDEGKARMGRVLETRTGLALGTPLYMAPEQIGGKRVDERADLYALGCVAYHLLTGRPPFGGDALTLMQMHLQVVPTPPSRVAAAAAPLDAWVLRALAKDPSDRFPTARAMLDALESATGHAAPSNAPVAPTNEARPTGTGTEPLTAAQLASARGAASPEPPAAAVSAPHAERSDTLFVSSELDKLNDRFPGRSPEELLDLAGDDARPIVGLSPRTPRVQESAGASEVAQSPEPSPSPDPARSTEPAPRVARRDFERVALVGDGGADADRVAALAIGETEAAARRALEAELAARRALRTEALAAGAERASVRRGPRLSFGVVRAIVPLVALTLVLLWWLFGVRG